MEARERALDVEWVPIDQLAPNPANPRLNDDAVPHVAASIRRFGWQQPIVARPSGEIVAGHTRWKAAKTLGLASVPVLRFTGSDLDATAFAIADNRTAEFANWDSKALASILQELRAEDSLDGVGYEASDIDELLESLETDLAEGGDVDDPGPQEPPETPTSRTGDLWLLGNHRLLCGDSSVDADVDRLLDGNQVHLVNTDPPYNVNVEPRTKNAIAAGSKGKGGIAHHQKLDLMRDLSKAKPNGPLRARDRTLENDFISPEEFDRLLRAWFKNAQRALIPGGGFYIWGGYANVFNYPSALQECADMYFSQAIIWVKHHPVLTRKDFMGDHEWCFYGWKKGAAHRWFGPNNERDVWEVPKVSPVAMVHLTEKPVELAARAMRNSSQKGERVLDLFGGSGSTLIAGEELGRSCLLIDKDGPYCDVILNRWQKATGKSATLEGDGRTFEEVADARAAEEESG